MAARTVSNMRDEVRIWVGADAKRMPNARLDNIINDIMQDISRRADLAVNARTAELEFWTVQEEWAGGADDFDGTVSGDTDITYVYTLTTECDLPSDFSVQEVVYLLGDDGKKTYISHIPYDDYMRDLGFYYSGGSDDAYYTIANGKMFLTFQPAYETIVYMDYFGTPPIVGEDTDGNGTVINTSEFFVKYWDIIFQGAVAEAFKYALEEQRYALFRKEYDQRLTRMFIQESRVSHAGGRIESQTP